MEGKDFESEEEENSSAPGPSSAEFNSNIRSPEGPDAPTNPADLFMAWAQLTSKNKWALDCFAFAKLIHDLTAMPEPDFQELRGTVRQIIKQGAEEIKGKLDEVPEPLRSTMQAGGVLPKELDVSDCMRYITEVERMLAKFRKETRS